MLSPFVRRYNGARCSHGTTPPRHRTFWGLHAVYSHYNVSNVSFPFGIYSGVKDRRLQGDITVHIYKTQNAAASQIVNNGEVNNAKQRGRYDVEAVYGGGNAASVPETNVTMNGCYEVGWLFGGGHGAGEGNPGANVGLIDVPSDNATTVTTKPYGTGNANTNIQGGTVGHLFGGSNERGNIVGIASMNLNEPDDCDCPINVTEELFGFGNAATMDGDGNMNIGCVSGTIAEVYGGAKAADVGGSIDLHINSGTFGKVFGGNKNSGTVSVTIEETGCKSIVIRELYGAGNMAAYTAPEELPDYPKVNIVSCTEIGYVYGGGYGETAVVRGNPQVCVNMEKGAHATLIGDQLGTIGTIFGGGNQADVNGKANVLISQ